MAPIDKHGMKMTGLKKASGNTCDYGYYSGEYDEVFYDRGTGEVWTKFQFSLGQNSWTEYHDSDIIKICNASRHMTMQEIADLIARKVAEMEIAEENMRELEEIHRAACWF